jgi:hypothetical protein
MNIFAVNNNPLIAACDLPDKLVVKMPTESVQLLTPWAFNVHNVYIEKPDGTNYGTKGFAHHPCAKWLYESPANVLWLWEHAQAMSEEYTARYHKQHGVNYALSQLEDLIKWHYPEVDSFDHTEFVQAMPDEFKVPGDPVQAYRNYINGYKGYAVWNFSEKPSWWDETKHEPVRNQYLAEREAKRIKRKNDKYPRVPSAV